MTVGLKNDGTEFPCEMSLSAWKYDGKTYFTSIIRDLTHRKKADDELIKAKEEWENTFNAVPDLITILDNDYHVIRANKAMEDSLGVKKGDAVGVHCYEAVHGTDSPPLFCPHTLLLKDGHEHTVEVHEGRIGGDFIVSVSPLYDSEGKLMGSVHVARDITERKKAEEALKESEEKFKGIFDNANDMISLNIMNETGLPGKFLEVNEAGSIRLGYTREELLSMSPPDIVARENRSQMQGNAAILLEKGHNTFEIVHVTKNGGKIPVEVNNHLINYKGQEICLAITRDITERKIVEKQLQESLEEKEMLLKEIHHRVKNNLMVISSLLNLQSRYIKDKEALDIFKESQNRAKSMALIHERLYRSTDLKKIDFGDYIHTTFYRSFPHLRF